jgi:hypothetical protein
VRTYDADSGNFPSESRVDEGFRRYMSKACATVFQAVGFSPGEKAVVAAEPFVDYGNDSPSQDSCVQKKGFWLIDFAIPAVNQLPDAYKVQHCGKDATNLPSQVRKLSPGDYKGESAVSASHTTRPRRFLLSNVTCKSPRCPSINCRILLARLDDTFHPDLSCAIHNRNRNAFLVHIHTDILFAIH